VAAPGRLAAAEQSGASARERILDVTERLMSERGFADVSVREIAAAARVPLSGISYYFGSKEKCLEAIFDRRAGALNSERAALLDRCEPDRLGRAPSVRELLQAFCEPAFALARQTGGARFLQLQNRLLVQEDALSQRIRARYMEPMSRRLVRLLSAACPDLPMPTVYWRFNFTVGALFATLRNKTRIESLSGGVVRVDYDTAWDELQEFLVSAWQAPVDPGAPRPRLAKR
jgi:AcrR family transcriptional regulator